MAPSGQKYQVELPFSACDGPFIPCENLTEYRSAMHVLDGKGPRRPDVTPPSRLCCHQPQTHPTRHVGRSHWDSGTLFAVSCCLLRISSRPEPQWHEREAASIASIIWTTRTHRVYRLQEDTDKICNLPPVVRVHLVEHRSSVSRILRSFACQLVGHASCGITRKLRSVWTSSHKRGIKLSGTPYLVHTDPGMSQVVHTDNMVPTCIHIQEIGNIGCWRAH